MSLKAFHIFFIAVSILLSFGFAGWLFQRFAAEGNILSAVGGALSVLAGIGLSLYGVRILKKLKHVSYL